MLSVCEYVCTILFLTLVGSHLRESIQRGVYVDGLLEQVVTSATDAYHVSSTSTSHTHTHTRVDLLVSPGADERVD